MSKRHLRRALGLVVMTAALVGTSVPYAQALAVPASPLAHPSAIGSNSCQGTDACLGATGNIGDNACNGEYACKDAAGDVGNDSCNGDYACRSSAAMIGANSCNGGDACDGAVSGPIGDGSCNEFFACNGASGAIGDGSCNDTEACEFTTGDVGQASCNGYTACYQAAAIGSDSCNADYACYQSSGGVGDHSCNGDSNCYTANGAVGNCENNDVDPPECAATYTPDGQVRRPGGARRGNDIYNSDANGQMVFNGNNRYRAGTVRWIYLYVQNDGNANDSYTIDAADPVIVALVSYDIRYFRPGGAEITADVSAGTFTTPELAPGATYGIRARVEVTPGAPHGSEVTQLVAMTSVADSGQQDTVGFRFRRN